MKNRSSLLIAALVIISAIVAFNPSIAKAEVHVYDKDNQDLGILLELHEQYLFVFIPSVGASMGFHYWTGEICEYGNAVFITDNCSDAPYSEGPLPQIIDLSLTYGGFYKPNNSGKQIFTPGSYYDDNCVCKQNTGEDSRYSNGEYYPLIQVQLPFTTPIALPLRFEVETQTVTQTEIMPFPIVVTPKNK